MSNFRSSKAYYYAVLTAFALMFALTGFSFVWSGAPQLSLPRAIGAVGIGLGLVALALRFAHLGALGAGSDVSRERQPGMFWSAVLFALGIGASAITLGVWSFFDR